jgi:hypothetical protein
MEIGTYRNPAQRDTRLEVVVTDAELAGELDRSKEDLLYAMVSKMVERFASEMLLSLRKPMMDAMIAAINELGKKE